MRLLVVTEKCGSAVADYGGGNRMVTTLQRAFGDAVSIAQFGDISTAGATWTFPYPAGGGDRFARRIERGGFVAARVRELSPGFTHVLFVHLSMQFGFADEALANVRTWTLPMFLTPSYVAAGETVPAAYTAAERAALARSDRVLTPSHLERRQLVDDYGVAEDRIRVVPRGIDLGGACGVVRELGGPLRICSVGAIKRQKNSIGLLRAFAAIRDRRPDARLRVIGPVQDPSYAAEVDLENDRLGLRDAVELIGYVPPDRLAESVADCHLHLSTSSCETFGRSIFETLALGLPNVARAANNAAAEYLHGTGYARFVDDLAEVPAAVEQLVAELPLHSSHAQEVGRQFDDDLLSRLLVAELCDADVLAISDWDGTLFHEHDDARTQRSMARFRRFARRVIVTAREVADTLEALARYELAVDWVIGCSGAVITDGRGSVVWRNPLDACELAELERRLPGARPVTVDGVTVQLACDTVEPSATPSHRIESYGGRSFVTRRDTSKLLGVQRLLGRLSWRGRVRVFGDGRYDDELLTFFDGTRILAGRPMPAALRTRWAQEIGDVDD